MEWAKDDDFPLGDKICRNYVFEGLGVPY